MYQCSFVSCDGSFSACGGGEGEGGVASLILMLVDANLNAFGGSLLLVLPLYVGFRRRRC